MCEAYNISVDDLEKIIVCFEQDVQDELLKYVPMGSNYCDKIHGCDNNNDGSVFTQRVTQRDTSCKYCLKKTQNNSVLRNDCRMSREFNKLKCTYYQGDEYYRNTNITLEEHLKRTHPPPGHNIVVHPYILEIILNAIHKLWICQILLIQKCIYDSSKQEAYEYKIKTHSVVHLLGSDNPRIQEWLDTVVIKGFTLNNKKGSPNPLQVKTESYESMYMNESMTIRQHVELYQRDSEQCNYNTVNYGTEYHLLISQSQFDLLKNAYIDDKNLKSIYVEMNHINGTNTITNFIGSAEIPNVNTNTMTKIIEPLEPMYKPKPMTSDRTYCIPSSKSKSKSKDCVIL